MTIEPPPDFEPIDYDLPPPPPDEIGIVDRPVLSFAAPDFDLPPPRRWWCAPPPVYIVDLPPPPPPEEVFVLPTPAYAPLPVWVNRPDYVAPPPVNIIAYNIHNTVIVNKGTVVVKDRAGNPVHPLANAAAVGALAPHGAVPPANTVSGRPPHVQTGQPPLLAPKPVGAGALAAGGPALPAAGFLRVALPPSVAARAQRVAGPASGAPLGAHRAGDAPNANGAAAGLGAGQAAPPGHALPGQPTAKPLPLQLDAAAAEGAAAPTSTEGAAARAAAEGAAAPTAAAGTAGPAAAEGSAT